jgi:hypothetical protein
MPEPEKKSGGLPIADYSRLERRMRLREFQHAIPRI